MQSSKFLIAMAVSAACASYAHAQKASDDFDIDTTSSYTIVTSGDAAATFAFDYSALGIPSAPGTPNGTTLGLKLEANLTSGASHAVTLHTNQTFEFDQVITFDAWINAVGPFPGGGAGSTEFLTCGVGGDGASVNRGGATGSGAWFATDGEGGSSRDYRAYKDANEQFAESLQFAAGTSSSGGGAHNNSDPYYAQFGGIDVAALPGQGASASGGFPSQTGVTAVGSFGFAWHQVAIVVDADGGSNGEASITWSIDGLTIATLDSGNGTSVPTNGTVTIGYMDIFSSLSGDPTLSFGLIDNLNIVAGFSGAAPLQMTEIVVTPTDGEFVEIFNPTSKTVMLDDYYLTDATFAGGSTYYWQLTTGGGGGGGFGDFYARFPAGSCIAPGEYQTIAMASGAVGFNTIYAINPTYELVDTDPSVPDMLEATPGSINGQGGLTNAGEMCVLLYWDGASELVTDCDYAVWGDKVEAVDKTGVTVGSSTYQPDTPIANQETIAGATSSSHTFGNSWQRQTNSEGVEIATGGNGADGSDETSENASVTWVDAPPTPGTGAVGAVTAIITPSTAGAASLSITGGGAGDVVALVGSTTGGLIPIGFLCPGEGLRALITPTSPIAVVTLDGSGNFNANFSVMAGIGTVHLQAIDVTLCRVSNVTVNTY